MSVWGEFDQGEEWGAQEGGRIRNARAYQQGGLDAVGEAAGRSGDLDTVYSTDRISQGRKRFDDERMQNAYERMNQIAPRARNIIRATRNMDAPRAQAFLNQNRRFFEDWGFSADQVDAGIAGLASEDPEVRAQWQDQLDAAFTQHENPDWKIMDSTTGEIGGIDPNSGRYLEGGTAPVGAGREWRPARADEMEGFQPGTAVDINVQTGERRARQNPHYARAGGGAGDVDDGEWDYYD